jgi:hypothetical protein
MILTQLRLFKVGIFTPAQFFKANDRIEFFNLQDVYSIFNIYIEKFLRSLTPTFPILSLILFVFIVYQFTHAKNLKLKTFFLSWILAPIWLIALHFRSNGHILIGLEIALFILFSIFLVSLKLKKKYKYTLIFLILFFYLTSQISLSHHYKDKSVTIFSPQRGVFLTQQLELIDKTYEIANSQPFSISSFTNPYNYNITWAYLYDWYGKSKYGYVPNFYGFTQKDFFGADLLPEISEPEQTHFYIIEPDTGAAEGFLEINIKEQNKTSTPMERNYNFGSISLQHRQKINQAQTNEISE